MSLSRVSFILADLCSKDILRRVYLDTPKDTFGYVTLSAYADDRQQESRRNFGTEDHYKPERTSATLKGAYAGGSKVLLVNRPEVD